MKLAIGNSILLGLALATATVAGCSSGAGTTGTAGSVGSNSHQPGTSETTGAVGMKLTLPNSTTLTSVQYTLTNGGGTTVQTGTVNVTNSQSIDFQLGLIPSGSGYTVTLTAGNGAGVSCVGSVGPFTVVPHATTSVQVNLICSTALPDAGNVDITGIPTFCAQWASLATVNPNGNGSEVNADGTTAVTLSATAVSSDAANVTYTYTQSAPAIGTFGANNASGLSDSITFVCSPSNQTRTTTVTLTVGENNSDGGPNSACPGSTVTALITCDGVTGAIPDAGSDATVDSGSDAGVDSGSDAAVDSGSDAGVDSGSDAAVDSGSDASDSSADVQNDAPPPPPTTDGILLSINQACLDCAAINACDDQNGGANNNCEDFGTATIPATAAEGAGMNEQTLCLNTLQCLATNRLNCIHSGSAQACLCGTSTPAQCTSTFNPGVVQNGPCQQFEVPGLETNNAAQYPGIFTQATLPAGRANNMITCLSTSACTTCFQ